MGWKIVRNGNEAWSRDHGVSGQWRVSADPVAALTKKLFEEAGEYTEHGSPDELYDLLDVVEELIRLKDPDGRALSRHTAKTRLQGEFSEHVEWNPVPSFGELER
jgi:predicted house-cleaning noncanonical NTP pyrophosphatase (MazG superfamily)